MGRRPWRWVVLTVGTLAVLLPCLVGLRLVLRDAARPVYTVAALQDALANGRRLWLGRTVAVRGVVWRMPCLPDDSCVQPLPVLSDDIAQPTDPNRVLPVAPFGPSDSTRASLRRIPLLELLVPRPQRLLFGRRQTYLVRLAPVPPSDATYQRPYEALLLDPAQVPW